VSNFCGQEHDSLAENNSSTRKSGKNTEAIGRDVEEMSPITKKLGVFSGAHVAQYPFTIEGRDETRESEKREVGRSLTSYVRQLRARLEGERVHDDKPGGEAISLGEKSSSSAVLKAKSCVV